MRTLQDVKTYEDYDFLDLGAGDGSSLSSFAKKMYGGRGLGIEFDKRKVEKAQAAKINVVLGDVLGLDSIPGKVKYTVCDNFLEHLPNRGVVESALGKAARVTQHFIYIRHPSFEDIDYLSSRGLKTYWSDWRGHTSMLSLSDIIQILHVHGIDLVQIYPVGRIYDSSDPSILPLSAPIDQHEYEKSHGPKPANLKFDREIFHAYDIVGMIPGSHNKRMPVLRYKDRLGSKGRPDVSQFYSSGSSLRLLKRIARNRVTNRLRTKLRGLVAP